MQALRLTIREASGSINRQFGGRLVPDWKLRRIVDVLENQGAITVQRIGTYRTVSDQDIPVLANELRRLGWIAPMAEVASC